MDRKLRIIEIGCGLGDVTTIPCYLGFDKVISFEKNPEICERTVRRLDDLFNRGPQKNSGGRNNSGKMTVRYIGGGKE